MNSQTIQSTSKRVFGPKNASSLPLAQQQRTINNLDKENVATGNPNQSPDSKKLPQKSIDINQAIFKYGNSLQPDQISVGPGHSGEASPEAGPSRPKSSKRKGSAEGYASTSNAKRARIAGSSLAYSGPPSTPIDTTDHITGAHQLPSEGFNMKQGIVDNDGTIKEPTRPAANEGNGYAKQHYIDRLIEDDRNHVPAAIAASATEADEGEVIQEQEVQPTANVEDTAAFDPSSCLEGGFTFGRSNTEGEEWAPPSYDFEPFLGSDFDPFTLSSGDFASSPVELGKSFNDWLTGPSNGEVHSGMALWDLGSEAFLALEESPDEPSTTTPEAKAEPVEVPSGTSKSAQKSGANKKPVITKNKAAGTSTSGLQARKRSTPSEYITTQQVDVAELLNRELPTIPYQFTAEDEEMFLAYVRLKDDKAAFSLLPEDQKVVVLDTPQEIAAYRAVHPPSHSLKNVEEKLLVCRALVKVVRTNEGETVGQVEYTCPAVGSLDSLRRHWRRSHLA